MRPKILLVHERRNQPAHLLSRLEHEGFQVFQGSGRVEALEIVYAEDPDVVILDLQIPLLEEVEICRRIRRESGIPLLPVLILKGEVDTADRMIALEHGVDEVLAKPCKPPVVVDCVRSLLRRGSPAGHGRRVKAGGIEINFDRHSVTVSGRSLQLTLKEFTLLKSLLRAAGRVVRREDLFEEVWGYERGSGIESRTLDVHMQSLRRKLGAASRHIITVRKVGYLFDLVPERIDRARRSSRDRR